MMRILFLLVVMIFYENVTAQKEQNAFIFSGYAEMYYLYPGEPGIRARSITSHF